MGSGCDVSPMHMDACRNSNLNWSPSQPISSVCTSSSSQTTLGPTRKSPFIGAKTYTLLRSLALPQDKSFDELQQHLKHHFEPEPLVIAERFRFHRRDQVADESIAKYLAELKRLTTHCKFGVFLDEALRDRMVRGLRSEMITQKRLLDEPKLTLEKALEVAQGIEAAVRHSRAGYQGNR